MVSDSWLVWLQTEDPQAHIFYASPVTFDQSAWDRGEKYNFLLWLHVQTESSAEMNYVPNLLFQGIDYDRIEHHGSAHPLDELNQIRRSNHAFWVYLRCLVRLHDPVYR